MRHRYQVVTGGALPLMNQLAAKKTTGISCCKLICMLLLICSNWLPAHAQKKAWIKGLIEDEKGRPIPGASVQLKSGPDSLKRYAVTNEQGVFIFDDSQQQGPFVFSIVYVGYVTQHITKTHLDPQKEHSIYVVLKESSAALGEVVVVGYGTQKKLNLTGAVDQVGKEVFENRPMTSATKGLQGALPNLNIRITDGKPIRGATYNVRGTTSIGAGGSALVLIDGVPGDPDLLNPNDIESVSVLKDAASAAIYGARGSFGVVLITTKHPAKDRTQLTYSGNYSLNDRTIRPNLITNGYEWAKNFDEAFYAWNDYKSHPQKANSVFPFSLDYLDELKRRNEDPSLPQTVVDPATGNYIYYGSTDWFKELYADNNPATEQTLSVSGGSAKSEYYLSGRYMSQNGIFRYNPDKFKMYNVRAKGAVKPFSWLRVENNFDFSQRTYFYPILNHPGNTPVWRRISDEAFPVAMLKNPDGTLTENASIVFGSFISGNNYSDQTQLMLRNTSRFTTSFLDNRLHINGDFTYAHTSGVETRLYTPVPYSKAPGVILTRGESKMNEDQGRTNYTGMNLYADFEQRFAKHYFKILMGYNYENTLYKSRYFQRDGIINTDLPDFSLMNGLDYRLTGGGYEWRTLGGFFRLNYNYDERYLLEVNGRYDGSSKFPRTQQYGFFPSASAGWRVSKEKFWHISPAAVSDFKIRASYGSLGNGNVDPYQFLEKMAVKKMGMVIGGILPDYTQKPNVIPDGLTWEKSTTVNVGVDAAFLSNRLKVNFDKYTRYTTNMFTVGQPLPAVFGDSVPKGNYADLKTKGWELSVNWSDAFQADGKPFNYSVGVVLSDNVSYITRFNNPSGLINTYYEGMRVGDFWGFVNDGYFENEAAIKNHKVDQSFIRVSNANILKPGDIRYKDLDGNGKIDQGKGTLGDPGDQQVVGNSEPRYAFGVTGAASWNNFFINVFFQGVGKRDWWPGTDASLFWGQYNRPYSWMPAEILDNRWSEENPDAYFPRFRGYTALNANAELTVKQQKYVQNVAYVRLKNLTVGYNLPKEWISKAKIQQARIYFTGQNLWTWSPMYRIMRTLDPEVIEGGDPELSKGAGNGMSYPMLKTYTVGVSVTF
ncbi:SusC/RagA family TonB-linked outer membrane protein [Chitinophaga nivalis]|uniref:TonB-dependent receptor n=1 Tax=Chitinophaga nivalis TaxID=2991709 RepID=A0ABT3IFI5_9BACT|nr:TonB-dependent receptor [Chitinophaga nivalis]MCW3467591.1 TonB-dependent receptor [Chitinophaga nivalis]MCW3482717.1 TonB-dependent receptor [Chitinophaga nivalis]